LQVERVFLFINLLLNGKGIGFLPKRIAKPFLQTEQLKLIECSFNEDLPTDQAYILYLKRSKYLVEDFISELLSHEKMRISS